jgi:hypothetical protein
MRGRAGGAAGQRREVSSGHASREAMISPSRLRRRCPPPVAVVQWSHRVHAVTRSLQGGSGREEAVACWTMQTWHGRGNTHAASLQRSRRRQAAAGWRAFKASERTHGVKQGRSRPSDRRSSEDERRGNIRTRCRDRLTGDAPTAGRPAAMADGRTRRRRVGNSAPVSQSRLTLHGPVGHAN